MDLLFLDKRKSKKGGSCTAPVGESGDRINIDCVSSDLVFWESGMKQFRLKTSLILVLGRNTSANPTYTDSFLSAGRTKLVRGGGEKYDAECSEEDFQQSHVSKTYNLSYNEMYLDQSISVGYNGLVKVRTICGET